jgi:1,4-alpha-glucan branching enzyme
MVSRAPVMSFAMAAGFAILVAMTTLAATVSGPLAKVVAHNPDTVHVIRFVYHDAAARQIAVVGDFNGWGATEIPLTANGDGVWSASVALPAGAHEYAFVVDHDQWVADPAALSSRDEFGTPTSRVKVGAVDFTATE